MTTRLTAVCLCLSLAAPADALWGFGESKPEGPLGAVLADAAGPVSVRKNGQAAFAPAVRQSALDSGDEVRTGAGGRAVVVFLDGSKMQVKDNAVFRVADHSAKKVAVNIDVGLLQFWITKQARKRRYTMRSPTAVASVRGTAGEMDVAPSGETNFALFEGSLGVSDTRGVEVRLEPRQQVTCDDKKGLEDAKVESLPPTKTMEAAPTVSGEPKPGPAPTQTQTPPPGDQTTGTAPEEPAATDSGQTTTTNANPTQDAAVSQTVSGSTP